jgi:hypothetical protein
MKGILSQAVSVITVDQSRCSHVQYSTGTVRTSYILYISVIVDWSIYTRHAMAFPGTRQTPIPPPAER